jgi:hypothetical protein
MKLLIAFLSAVLLAVPSVSAHAQSTDDGAPTVVISTPTPQVAYANLRGQLVYILRLRLLGLQTRDQQILTTTSGQLEVFDEDILGNFDWDQSAPAQALHTAVSSARSHTDDAAALQSDLDALERAIPTAT